MPVSKTRKNGSSRSNRKNVKGGVRKSNKNSSKNSRKNSRKNVKGGVRKSNKNSRKNAKVGGSDFQSMMKSMFAKI